MSRYMSIWCHRLRDVTEYVYGPELKNVSYIGDGSACVQV